MRKCKKHFTAALCVLFAALLAGCAGAPADSSRRELGQNGAHSETAAQQVSESEMGAYLFVHFIGSEGEYDAEQVYFSVSRDGTNWERLNGRAPVLKSTVGEKGIRDPHIIRSPDGNKFYIIATDLSIHHGGLGWGNSQTQGSKSIVVWESDNLVDWSESRLQKIARDNAGCTWAPESIYDKEKDAYMVFWASKTSEDWTHRIYRCYTKDFVTFTEPELYIENDFKTIDTTFIEYDGVYYRFSKNEDDGQKFVYMERGTSLSGDFELVGTYTLDGEAANKLSGVEGATAYKINGEDKWCLFVDKHNNGGYLPFVTDDLASGRFTSGSDFYFGIRKWLGAADDMRHGSVLPITVAEYNALIDKYGLPDADEQPKGELVVSLDFEDSLEGVGKAVAQNGDPEYGEGVNGGKALRLNSNYIQIAAEEEAAHPLSNCASATVSFAAKRVGNSSGEGNSSWLFYAAPYENAQTYRKEDYVGALDFGNRLKFERYFTPDDTEKDRTASVEVGDADNWKHITIVYDTVDGKSRTAVYVNGTCQGYTVYDGADVALNKILGENPFVCFGYGNWESGQYANAWIDGVRIYNYALNPQEVYGNYQAVMGA